MNMVGVQSKQQSESKLLREGSSCEGQGDTTMSGNESVEDGFNGFNTAEACSNSDEGIVTPESSVSGSQSTRTDSKKSKIHQQDINIEKPEPKFFIENTPAYT